MWAAIRNEDIWNVELLFDGALVGAGVGVCVGARVVGAVVVGVGGSVVVCPTKSVCMLMIFGVMLHLLNMTDVLGQSSMLCDFDNTSANYTK